MAFKRPGRFKGILFDFDGTLARTMEDHFLAWHKVMGRHHVDIKSEDYYPLEGLSLSELAKRFLRMGKVEQWDNLALVKEVVDEKERCYLTHNQFDLYPGVEAFVDVLHKQGVSMGIVTAGLRPRLESSVPKEFLDKFGVLVTGEQGGRGKPHPGPYLKGAEVLHLTTQECVVIENSPLGIESAKSANAYCIGVCSTLDKSYLNKADQVVGSFKDLESLPVIRENFLQVGPF